MSDIKYNLEIWDTVSRKWVYAQQNTMEWLEKMVKKPYYSKYSLRIVKVTKEVIWKNNGKLKRSKAR